jgi:hypothetical protein
VLAHHRGRGRARPGAELGRALADDRSPRASLLADVQRFPELAQVLDVAQGRALEAGPGGVPLALLGGHHCSAAGSRFPVPGAAALDVAQVLDVARGAVEIEGIERPCVGGRP